MTAQGPLTQAVAEALKAAQIPNGDVGAVALAKEYAAILDEARGGEDEITTFAKLGPALLAALTSLGMTAAGRGVKGGGPSVAPIAFKLDELRARREQRSAGQHDS